MCGSGEVISTGLDKKNKFWDTRQGQSLVLSTDAGTPVRCITVNGNNLVVCVQASMLIYDLRSLDRPFQSYESQVEVPIRCLTSVPFSTGNVAMIFHRPAFMFGLRSEVFKVAVQQDMQLAQ